MGEGFEVAAGVLIGLDAHHRDRGSGGQGMGLHGTAAAKGVRIQQRALGGQTGAFKGSQRTHAVILCNAGPSPWAAWFRFVLQWVPKVVFINNDK